MAAHVYQMTSRWRVGGTVAAVQAVLLQGDRYPDWWSEAFVQVRRTDGARPELEVESRGFLPYTLRWRTWLVASAPGRIVQETTGDFVGTGVWTLQQDGAEVVVTFDWRVRVEKPLVRALSWLLRPVFALNHRWAMARGERGLRRRMAA